MYRRALLILAAAVLSSTALFGAFAPIASAATVPQAYKAQTVYDAAIRSTERNGLGVCLGVNNGYNAVAKAIGSEWSFNISQDDIVNMRWFAQGNDVKVRQWFDSSTQKAGTQCRDINLPNFLSDLGLGTGVNAACNVGFQRQNGSNCINGDGDFRWPSNLNKQGVLNNIDKKYQGYDTLGKDYSREQYYVMALDTLQSSVKCNAKPLSAVSDNIANDKATADDLQTPVVDSSGKKTMVYYQINGDKKTEWAFRNGLGNDFSGGNGGNCARMIGIMAENADAYAAWVTKNPSGTTNNAGTCSEYAKQNTSSSAKGKDLLAACEKGLKNKSDGNYCSKTYPIDPQSTNIDPRYKACVYGAKTAVDPNATNNTGTDGDEQTKCQITGIGWFVCPAMNFMATVADGTYTFLANYFLSVDTGTVEAARPSWEKFRDIANVAFVIAIIFIVYSQLTSMGISNYGIKRMLPKLAIAAILVNTSFFICQIAVDLSNVIGFAIPKLLNTTIQLGAGGAGSDGTVTGAILANLTWVGVIGGILAGGVALALAISAPVLLAALLAIAMIVFILIARQAIIVLLIVVAPLAFVAYLLPNTEQWFKKWYKMFFTMLMLFPIIGIVFGASQLAGTALYNATGNSGADYVNGLTALAVTAIPFFVVPGMLKGALSATGALGNKMQGFANKATGKVGGKVKSSSKLGAGLADMKSFREKQRAIKFAKGRGKGVMGTVGTIVGRKSASGETTYNQQALIRAEQLENQEYEENVKAAMDQQARHTTFDQKKAIAYGQVAASDVERDAAVRFIGANGNFNERRELLESMGTMDKSLRRSAIGAARSKGDTSMFGSPTLGYLEDADDIGGPEEIRARLEKGFASKINEGGITAETFHADPHRARYMTEQLVGKLNKDGDKVVDPSPQNSYITTEGREKMANSLASFANSDKAQGLPVVTTVKADMIANKAGISMANIPQGGNLPGGNQSQAQTPQQTVINQPQPQAPSAVQQPGPQQAAPQQVAPTVLQAQPQSNGNQLTIPHNTAPSTSTTTNNIKNVTTNTTNTTNNDVVNNETNTVNKSIPGTSNFVQSPSGLFVPPSALRETPPQPTNTQDSKSRSSSSSDSSAT